MIPTMKEKYNKKGSKPGLAPTRSLYNSKFGSDSVDGAASTRHNSGISAVSQNSLRGAPQPSADLFVDANLETPNEFNSAGEAFDLNFNTFEQGDYQE
jgi:hypothetical protein